MIRLLMVVTGVDHLTLIDGTIRKTGFWAEELVVPHELFKTAGFIVEIATPGGVPAPLDQESLTPEKNSGGSKVIKHFKEYLDSLEDLKHPLVLERLSQAQVDSYDAIFLPGGHGPLQDLAHSPELGEILSRMQEDHKLIAAVCHGSAGLLPATHADGTWTFQGYRLTGFTNQEEHEVGLAAKMPFLLETRLRDQGADFQSGKSWMPYIITDRNLVTGQNPTSSFGVAEATIAWLSAQVSSSFQDA
ncbi:Putative intracellular protease/amidase [Singulisphaera sp. GP187]|uniref:type 1 glutamine amidotransferase domain-containing protein n=1 Tax=Singulisphaera sp. GP187 TaxID=1882752 RepID=UPI000925BF0C|nr:type 1 glutamine amidotransferase domain-containing protein [Singulisphaera sp. GP187]SIO58060.1 Putative intracellular protease/amidase [Singulisphaera sp. GP187]